MGIDNSPEKSPIRHSTTRGNRKISPIKDKNSSPTPIPIKIQHIKNQSKLKKTLSSPKNIMNFIAQCENAILLKNMNDSNNISFNHINILFNPDIINPFLESHLKYIQTVEDSLDKKILLRKLKIKNKEFNQKQLETLTDDLIEINNDNSFNNNNFNIGNLSSIHKKKGKSREESPTSQRDDEFDLTSFSTTIGGKASNNISNTKSFGNNKMNNSKQVRTFKIRTKDGLVKGDNDNNRSHNSKYNSNNNSRNNSRNNSNSYRNNLLRKDSPNSINSNNSSNNNSNSNEIFYVNKDNSTNNFPNKNFPENTSLKEQNINKNDNNLSNKIVIRKKHNSCFSDINSFKTINVTKINKNTNIKNISKKIIRKKLIEPESILGPRDNIKSQRRNLSNIDSSIVNNISNIQENISYIDNNNLYINKTIADIVPKKQNCVLNKIYLGPKNNKRSKSPNIILIFELLKY